MLIRVYRANYFFFTPYILDYSVLTVSNERTALKFFLLHP